MEMKFTVFSDFHYEKSMEHRGVAGLKSILNASKDYGSQFVLHAGDFDRDWKSAPELLDVYLNNEYHLPVYGIYGNHDTESPNTPMSFVTRHLTNDENVVWGTEDGKIGDGEITWYYCDKGMYRFVFLDTNHHYFVREGVIKHTPAGMGEAPVENKPRHLLGQKQIAWLEGVLLDAAEKGMSCITVSHAGFSDPVKWGWISGPSDDIGTVRALFTRVNKMKPHTVIMCINGHYHMNHLDIFDDILFFDVNSCAGFWDGNGGPHYPDDVMYTHLEYDGEGNQISSVSKRVNELPYADKKWWLDRPIYANVSITDDFEITVEGTGAHWLAGIEPPKYDWVNCDLTKIDSGKFKL